MFKNRIDNAREIHQDLIDKQIELLAPVSLSIN